MNEENQTNNEEEVSEVQAPHEPTKEKSVGGTIGVIIIVVLLIIGGLYLFGQKSDTVVDKNAPFAEEILVEPDTTTAILETQGTSDEIEAIEADALATDLNGLDLELGDISTEFGNI